MKLDIENRRYIRQIFLAIGTGCCTLSSIHFWLISSIKDEIWIEYTILMVIGIIIVLIPLTFKIEKKEEKPVTTQQKESLDSDDHATIKQRKIRKRLVVLNNILFLVIILLFYLFFIKPQNETILRNKDTYASKIKTLTEKVNHYKLLLEKCKESRPGKNEQEGSDYPPDVKQKFIQGKIKIGSARNDTIVKSNIEFLNSQIGNSIDNVVIPDNSVTLNKSIFMYNPKGEMYKVDARTTIEFLNGTIEYELLPSGVTILWITVKTKES